MGFMDGRVLSHKSVLTNSASVHYHHQREAALGLHLCVLVSYLIETTLDFTRGM